jgi:hypothetical protein
LRHRGRRRDVALERAAAFQCHGARGCTGIEADWWRRCARRLEAVEPGRLRRPCDQGGFCSSRKCGGCACTRPMWMIRACRQRAT